MKTKEVLSILKDYSSESIDLEEAVVSLKNVEPVDLYLAETELIDRGFGNNELKKIAEVYLKVLSKRSDVLYDALPDEHPLKVLMKEHKKLESFLNIMDELREKIADGLTEEQRVMLERTVENLYELDKHISKEESVIFSRLNKGKMRGRTTLLTEEHGDIKKLRKRLKDLLVKDEDTEEISDCLDGIIYLLREHSYIENDLLYPVAYENLNDWEDIAAENGRIGDCEFARIPRVK